MEVSWGMIASLKNDKIEIWLLHWLAVGNHPQRKAARILLQARLTELGLNETQA
jgi:hypothetical protein